MSGLSKFQIKVGRRLYNIFSALNSFSFALVTGNIITLYAMYLGANSVTIGLLNSFNFLSFFAIPIGKMQSRKKPVMRVYASAWTMRNVSLLLMLPVPFCARAGYTGTGLLFILASAFLFNYFRGIGLVANNPVLADLAPGRDRGSYIVLISLVNNAAALIATLLLAAALRFGSSLTVLSAAVTIGIVSGFFASFMLYKMPYSKEVKTGHTGSFFSTLSNSVKDRNFRIFLAAFSIIGFGVGMARPFIIVFCREVYKQSDSMITLVSFFSTLGALCMGLAARLFIDRIGAKPIYLLFSVVSFVSLIPAVIAPSVPSAVITGIFLCALAFITNFGFSGEENAGQTYFFTIVSPQALLDLSIVYYFILGATGAMGSIFGGIILDTFADQGLSPADSYRFFFLIQMAIIAFSIAFQLRLKSMGSYSVRDALPLFFSLRDIRVFGLLHRLDNTEDPYVQTQLLSELGEVNSGAAIDNILQALSSPSFAVRSEALNSMRSLPALNPEAERILIRELKKGKYTTAYKAAQLLGAFKVKKAVDPLRTCVKSDDYQLAAEAMLSLAKIGDERSQFIISEVLEKTRNPHVLIWGIHAMQLYSNAAVIPVLQNVLRLDFKIADVQHEIMLAFAALMGIEKKFYPSYSRYIKDSSLAPELLADIFDETASILKLTSTVLPPRILDFLNDYSKSTEFIDNILTYTRTQKGTGILSGMLISSILDTDLVRFHSFRFFLCFWVIMSLGDPCLLRR